jgi:hypothetical protein
VIPKASGPLQRFEVVQTLLTSKQRIREMLRAGLITIVLGSLGSLLIGSAAMAHEHDHGYDQRHERWEGRSYDRHEWERRDWDRHYSDRAGRRRYWDGRAWVYLLPPPPHVHWHWDVVLGRYCP